MNHERGVHLALAYRANVPVRNHVRLAHQMLGWDVEHNRIPILHGRKVLAQDHQDVPESLHPVRHPDLAIVEGEGLLDHISLPAHRNRHSVTTPGPPSGVSSATVGEGAAAENPRGLSTPSGDRPTFLPRKTA